MKYYIDGHNVLGAHDLPGDEKSIQLLTAKLTAYQMARQVKLVLVFDNFKNTEPYAYFSRHGNLQVFASDPNIDKAGADDCLVRLLEREPKVGSVTVVTADRGLKDRLRGVGVNHFMPPIEFMQIVDRALSGKKTTAAPTVQDDSKDDDLTEAERRQINEEMSRVFGRDQASQ